MPRDSWRSWNNATRPPRSDRAIGGEWVTWTEIDHAYRRMKKGIAGVLLFDARGYPTPTSPAARHHRVHEPAAAGQACGHGGPSPGNQISINLSSCQRSGAVAGGRRRAKQLGWATVVQGRNVWRRGALPGRGRRWDVAVIGVNTRLRLKCRRWSPPAATPARKKAGKPGAIRAKVVNLTGRGQAGPVHVGRRGRLASPLRLLAHGRPHRRRHPRPAVGRQHGQGSCTTPARWPARRHPLQLGRIPT